MNSLDGNCYIFFYVSTFCTMLHSHSAYQDLFALLCSQQKKKTSTRLLLVERGCSVLSVFYQCILFKTETVSLFFSVADSF